MALDNRLLDDMARMASGAAGTLFGVRDEAEIRFRRSLERVLERLDLVTREEFEAVKDMAAAARAEQERLAETVAALEARLQELDAQSKPRKRSGGTKASGGRGAAATESSGETGDAEPSSD